MLEENSIAYATVGHMVTEETPKSGAFVQEQVSDRELQAADQAVGFPPHYVPMTATIFW